MNFGLKNLVRSFGAEARAERREVKRAEREADAQHSHNKREFAAAGNELFVGGGFAASTVELGKQFLTPAQIDADDTQWNSPRAAVYVGPQRPEVKPKVEVVSPA